MLTNPDDMLDAIINALLSPNPNPTLILTLMICWMLSSMHYHPLTLVRHAERLEQQGQFNQAARWLFAVALLEAARK